MVSYEVSPLPFNGVAEARRCGCLIINPDPSNTVLRVNRELFTGSYTPNLTTKNDNKYILLVIPKFHLLILKKDVKYC